MVIGFLEICGGILILYLFTQIFLPLCFPDILSYNWLFKSKKTKDLEKQAKELKQKKADYLKEVNNVKAKSKEELEKAKQTERKIRNLK